MIGVILKNSFEEFQNSDLSKLNEEQEQKILGMLQLSKLYEKFVELKYNVYCENRSKLNLDTEMGKSIVKDDSLDNIIKKLKHFALDSLYNENHLKVFLTETEIRNLNDKKDDVKENGDELGITNRIVDGKTHFIHKTFSEYFAAAFFVENLMKENQKSKIIIEYFLKNMMNAENSAICKFIDSMLDDKILHCTNYDEIPKMEIGIIFFVLKNNWQNIAKFLIDGGINLMGIHENNSVLHLASTLTIRNLRGKEKSILKLIVEKLKSNETEFKILLETKDSDGRTPLFLAIEYGRLDNLKILINTCKEYKILCNVLMEENCNENMLHVAVEENCVDDVLNYILDLLKNEPEKLKALLLKRSDKDDTPLSKATMNRQSNKLKAMLDVCHSHKILDNVFAAENRWGENVFHQAAGKYCHDKVFIHILDLLKSNPEKLKALLVKRSKNDDTPLDLAAIYGQSVKLKSMLDVCHELKILDSVFANENEKGESLLHLAVDGYWEDDIFIYLLNLLKCEPKNLENLLLKKDDDCTYLFLNRASCYAQWNKLKAMLDVCHDFNILDCILTNENRRGESLFHQAVREFWEDNVFIYLVDFFKNKPEKLKSILLKKNHCGYSPVDLPLVYHQSNKLEIMMKACQISESG